MTIFIDRIVMGYLDNNVYVVSDSEGAFIVDPSTRADEIVSFVGERKVDAILCTHFHSDHTGALADLKEATKATVYSSEPDAFYIEHPRKVGQSPVPLQECCKVDVSLHDNDVVVVGGMKWQALLTPGHSKGSMCFYLPKSDEVVLEGKSIGCVPVLLSGDTLFAGACGRTDFLGGSVSDMYESLSRLSRLPDDTVVLPGHNAFTTISHERCSTFLRWAIS